MPRAFGGEVRVAGMTVRSDDLIHADSHGAIVIPHDIAAKIPDAAELCGRRETPILEIARSPDFTLEKLKEALKPNRPRSTDEAKSAMQMKMDGKTVLITGSTDGVGRYVAARLAAAGAKVLIHGRDQARAKTLADEICRQGMPSRCSTRPICRRCPARGSLPKRCWPITSGSICSSAMPGSGRGHSGAERRTSADGHELRFAVNYLSGFLLAHLLLPLLKASAPSRIVNVASLGQHPIDFDDVMITKGYNGGPRLLAEQAVADHVHHRSRR